jgi:thiamine biosynthesis lipoprotein
MSADERIIEAMGGQARLWVADGDLTGAQDLLAEVDARLTRFDPASDLCVLNADPRDAVAVHPIVGGFVAAAIDAGRRTGGLVDATLGREIVAAGYREPWTGESLSLERALAEAPRRRPAGPLAAGGWPNLWVSARRDVVRRPAGVILDSGGIGKGLAADLLARHLRGRRFVVDVLGDLTLDAGDGPAIEVAVEHPMRGEPAHVFRLRRGAIATSGIARRLWRGPDGAPAHHLLDPATGRPAWTGVVSATAVGRTAVEAESLAKAALLSGPHAGRRVLAGMGGVLIGEDGRIEIVPALAVVAASARREWRVIA